MAAPTRSAPTGRTAVHPLGGDRDRVVELVEELAATFDTADDPRLVATARRIAMRELPPAVVDALTRFRDAEPSCVLLVEGFPVDDRRIGPTPAHWAGQRDPASTGREEIYFLLLGSVLGDAFGWSTLQGGHLVQNVVPIRGQEGEQSGHGSSVPLAWHTEDGFHPYRCDYLGLMSLRNDAPVPTRVAGIDEVALEPDLVEVLSEPRFLIRPDDEHLTQQRRDGADGDTGAQDWSRPAPSAVLFGDPADPYLRIDPYFMSAVPGDAVAADALDTVTDRLDRALRPVPLAPGTACFIDNYRAVHGRGAFRASYDGRDRWLKKLVLTRDLRKSRAVRDGVDDRVLHPRPRALRPTTTRPVATGGRTLV